MAKIITQQVAINISYLRKNGLDSSDDNKYILKVDDLEAIEATVSELISENHPSAIVEVEYVDAE